MKYTKFFRILAVAAVLALLVTVIPASPALAQHIRLDPEEGEIGDRIDITGYDFDYDSTVTIYFTSEEVDEGDDIDYVDAYEKVKSSRGVDEDGDFDTSFDVPSRLTDGDDTEDVKGGTYYVFVTYYGDDDIQDVATFTVIAGEIEIDPDDGPVGTEVDIDGSGFAEDENIDVYIDDGKLDEDYVVDGDLETDGDGDVDITIAIPELTAGKHTIKVEDDIGSSDEKSFTVKSEITIDPTSGKAGTSVTVRGTGFGDEVDVVIDFGTETGWEGTETDDDGSFSVTSTVPDLTPGTYKVDAEDDDNNSDDTEFTTLLVINVSLSKTTGNVGDTVTISGEGFAPSGPVTITYAPETTPVATTTTAATGVFSTTFTVPASKAGAHIVTATDGINTLTATFTMESTAPAIPAPLLPAMGVKAEQPVKFDWEDVTDPSGVTYTLQIATDEGFTDIELEKEGLTESKYTMTKELESTKEDAPYWWHVKAIDAASNESGWSGAGSFYVGFIFAMPDWAKYLLWALGGLVLLFIGFLLGRRTSYAY
jgi:hypothetical protein